MSASARLVAVRVKPNSRRPRIEAAPGGGLIAHVAAPPSEGRANRELLERLATHLGLPKSRLRIRSGASSRTKLVEIL